MAQASKAIIPKDVGGPFGKRVKVTVGGSLSWGLRVGAYVTGRVSSSDWLRYSLVVMNCGWWTLLNDQEADSFNALRGRFAEWLMESDTRADDY